MAECSKCGAEIPENKACISKELSSDEYTECWYFCGKCGVYTVRGISEPFFGDETVSTNGPIAKEEGDAKVALIGQCAEPWNKKCDCPAHREYFKDMS